MNRVEIENQLLRLQAENNILRQKLSEPYYKSDKGLPQLLQYNPDLLVGYEEITEMLKAHYPDADINFARFFVKVFKIQCVAQFATGRRPRDLFLAPEIKMALLKVAELQ